YLDPSYYHRAQRESGDQYGAHEKSCCAINHLKDLGPTPEPTVNTHWSSSCGLSVIFKLLEHKINTFFLHVQTHVMTIDQHDGSIPTRAHALGLLEGKQPIGRGLAIVNTELFLEVLARAHAIAQRTRQISAHRNGKAAHRLEMKHVIKGGDLLNLYGRHPQIRGHIFDNLGGHPPFFLLGNR